VRLSSRGVGPGGGWTARIAPGPLVAMERDLSMPAAKIHLTLSLQSRWQAYSGRDPSSSTKDSPALA
jgi:hypothetical protein